jgi:hypothetical protein
VLRRRKPPAHDRAKNECIRVKSPARFLVEGGLVFEIFFAF